MLVISCAPASSLENIGPYHSPDGTRVCLALDPTDESEPASYVRGLFWVCTDLSGRVRWTEGVRLAKDGLVDLDNLRPEYRALFRRTVVAVESGLVLPLILDVK